MRLQPVSAVIPPGGVELLIELRDGQSGFSGTPFGVGVGTIEDWVAQCRDSDLGRNLAENHVPQTTCWILNDAGGAVGMLRMRHHLNERLTHSGGHVGYFVRAGERRQGHAKAALRLAVNALALRGIARVLVTTSADNPASIGVIRAVGGVADADGIHPDSGTPTLRFWIDPH